MKHLIVILITLFSIKIYSQKKVLQHDDKGLWNGIKNVSISNNGDYVAYAIEKGEKDQSIQLKSIEGNSIFSQERTKRGNFSYDSKFLAFHITSWKDSIKELKRRKIKKKDLPKDTLAIYDITSKSLTKIPNIKSFALPKKWSSIILYQLEAIKKKKDTSTKKKVDSLKTKQKLKKVSKDNGYHMVVRYLASSKEDTLKYVTNYKIAEEGKFIVYSTTGIKDKLDAGVYMYDVISGESKSIYSTHAKSKFQQLGISKTGEKTAFVVDTDTTKALIRQPKLYLWESGQNSASLIVDSLKRPNDLLVSGDEVLAFSKNESRLFFGLRPTPIVKDTTLLDEEIVNVEVWTYNEPRLYTVQELNVNNDKKKSFLSLYDLNTKKMTQISNTDYDMSRIADEGDTEYAVIGNMTPYQLQSQWTAQQPIDAKLVNLTNGQERNLATKLYGLNGLSPKGKYAYGYSRKDSTWYTYNLESLKYTALTKNKLFYTEENDYPNDPYSYGIAGWTDDDKHVLIYDRYDIWSFNPETGTSERLTNGRVNKTVYRYIRLDNEEESIPSNSKWLLSTFNETNKYSGFFSYDAKQKKGKTVLEGPYRYGRPRLAQNDKDKRVIFTKESFTEFPNLWSSDLSFNSAKQITDVNPQQSDYNWGTAEMVEWTSLDGIPLKGMLIKPENFDPNKKYPMIVNFYEKSSDGLYRHRAPTYGRSTINYSYYASQGYLIFNPDVHYRIGYPGESALNCVVPGVTALIEKGFVDKDNIGVQGHSWGGYQIAYLVTKTDIFKAAESGAPVPNMISAYGGIRWWTGLSRQFQYEHTQSRIGGTPWEYPQRYIENSPIFNIDKINTPLLIMHNDADGHVPWYQGIEFFVSLRRLGKPSWFLNYNGEPHWPLKWQNRIDFNLRMSQFFDYYLKGKAKPVWMERGVPALEKGINQGYELIDEN